MCPGASRIRYCRRRLLKNTRAASIVMPWACSSLSASSRKAYSNGLELSSHWARTDSSLPSGSEWVSASSRPITVLLP